MVQARLISKSPDGRKAQVVVLMDGGHPDGGHRSITRHVCLNKGKWLGHNPDEPAIMRLDAAEKELDVIQHHYGEIASLAKTSIKGFAQFVSRIQRYRENAHGVPTIIFRLGIGILLAGHELKEEIRAEDLKAAVEAELAKAKAILELARGRTEKIRGEIPRYVEFSF